MTASILIVDDSASMGDATIVARTDGVPPLGELVPNHCFVGWDCTLIGDISRDAIKDVFLFGMGDMEITIEPLAVDADEAPIAVDAGPIAWAAGLPGAANDQSDRSAPTRAAQGEHVRVPAERLDELMDRVGDPVVAQSRLSRLAHHGNDLSLHRGVASFARSTILGNGSVALILDTAQLVALGQPKEERRIAAA